MGWRRKHDFYGGNQLEDGCGHLSCKNYNIWNITTQYLWHLCLVISFLSCTTLSWKTSFILVPIFLSKGLICKTRRSGPRLFSTMRALDNWRYGGRRRFGGNSSQISSCFCKWVALANVLVFGEGAENRHLLQNFCWLEALNRCQQPPVANGASKTFRVYETVYKTFLVVLRVIFISRRISSTLTKSKDEVQKNKRRWIFWKQERKRAEWARKSFRSRSLLFPKSNLGSSELNTFPGNVVIFCSNHYLSYADNGQQKIMWGIWMKHCTRVGSKMGTQTKK